VFKYKLAELNDLPPKDNPKVALKLPTGTRLLYVGMQEGHCIESTLCVWAEVDEDQDTALMYTFWIIGTGMEVPDGADYLGTVNLNARVFHIYWELA